MTGNKILPFPGRIPVPPETTDRVFLHLCDGWALGYDRLQWMLMKARNRRGQREWRLVSFIASEKRILERCIAENGVQPTPEARGKLEALHNTFKKWLLQQDQREVA